MALKADRYEESTDISFFYNEDTATRGGVVLIAKTLPELTLINIKMKFKKVVKSLF